MRLVSLTETFLIPEGKSSKEIFGELIKGTSRIVTILSISLILYNFLFISLRSSRLLSENNRF